MAREKGSVRVGPVSVFALVVIVSLAVLAVLSAATAHASYTEASAQAGFTESAYANDAAAAQALADIDAALAGQGASPSAAGEDSTGAADASPSATSQGSSTPASLEPAMQEVALVLPQGDVGNGVTAAGSIDGRTITMTFSTENGRTLLVVLDVQDNLTYVIEQWKVTTEWNQEPEETKLWQGA